MTAEQIVTAAWQRRGVLSTVLLPLAWLFAGVTALRRVAFRRGWLASESMDVPVCVVGNITVGGVGKTPLVIELVERLQQMGETPAVVSRGYGATIGAEPVLVGPDQTADQVGDEPLLIARRTGCIVAVHPDRVAAARAAQLAGASCIVADDGLQHYRLRRDLEIAVVDGDRGVGNARLLPAGPLREPVSRLRAVDAVVIRGGLSSAAADRRNHATGVRRGDLGGLSMQLRAAHLRPVKSASTKLLESVEPVERPLAAFSGESVLAVAAIGHPQRFFDALIAAGLRIEAHAFADHHGFTPADFAGFDDRPVIMTEKDAVKCGEFARPNWWYLPISATFSDVDSAHLDALLQQLMGTPV